jgi:hypothetical protein
LNRIDCPHSLRSINACDRKGLSNIRASCSCGSNAVGGYIKSLLTQTLLTRRYDIQAINGYISLLSTGIDFFPIYEQLCDNALEHMQCPVALQTNVVAYNFANWTATCLCGHYDLTTTIAETIFDAVMQPNIQSRVTQPNISLPQWDVCSSYYGICDLFLNVIRCPHQSKSIQTCGNVSSNFPYGEVQEFNGSCVCGTMDRLSNHVRDVIVDTLVAEKINAEYLYIPSPQPAYTLSASSNPFKPLLYSGVTTIPS